MDERLLALLSDSVLAGSQYHGPERGVETKVWHWSQDGGRRFQLATMLPAFCPGAEEGI